MATTGVDVEYRPPDLLRRFARFPLKTNQVMRKTMEASLLHLQGEIDPYPVAPPNVDASGRTGKLGGSLGVSQEGVVVGRPQIFTIKRLGSIGHEGRLGTRLGYADRVIGDQQEPWRFYWWTLASVARRARDGIVKIHRAAAEELTRFIDGFG